MTTYRLQRRLEADARSAATFRVLGAVMAFVVVAVVLAATGRNPLTIFWDGLDAVFGGQRGIEGTTLRAIPILMTGQRGIEGTTLRAIPILMTALAVALSLRMKVWNIGSDGQFLMGAFAALGVGIHVDGPSWLVLILMAVAATAAGALWILVPALARAYWDVNEIITTLLLNFVASQLVVWASLGFWRDEASAVTQSTERVPYILAALPGSDQLSIAVLVPLLLAGLLWWVFRSTKVGYEIDMIGGNPRAAEFAGIDVKRRIVLVMLVTGAIAGLGGMLQLSAPGAQALSSGFSAQFGLSGFIVAALAGGAFVGVLVGGFFIASLFFAGLVLQTKGLSVFIIFGIYGIILTGIALGEVAARYKVVRVEGTTSGRSASAIASAPAEEVSA